MFRLLFNSISITLLKWHRRVVARVLFWLIYQLNRSKEAKREVSIVSRWMMCFVLSHISNRTGTPNKTDSNRFRNSFCKLWILNKGESRSVIDNRDERVSSGWKIKYYLIIEANTRVFSLCCFANIYKSQQNFFSSRYIFIAKSLVVLGTLFYESWMNF